IKLADGFCFNGASAIYDPKRKELFARADFSLQSNAKGHYSCALAYRSADGKILNSLRWLNDRIEEVGENLGGHKYRMEFSLPVSSEQIADGSNLKAVILVRDNWSNKLLGPSQGIAIGNFVVE